MPHVSPWVADFPALSRPVHGNIRLAFLDSGASAQKPHAVLNAMQAALAGPYANIHRGLYANSAETTTAFEAARHTIATFLGAAPEGTIFTRNTTEGINLVASTFGRTHLKKESIVVLTELEHHANIVPWQLLQKEVGFTLRVIGLTPHGGLDMADAEAKLLGATFLGVTAMSNVLGIRPDVATLIGWAKAQGAYVLLDASQSAVHGPTNFASTGADFLVMTGHKLYGPTGIGVLVARPDLLNTLPPYQGGGDMIEQVSWQGTTFAQAPARFEAGTPAIAEAIGLAAACNYVTAIGWQKIQAHEKTMADKLEDVLKEAAVTRYATATTGHGIAAFNLAGHHPADVAMLLDQQGVAVRSGHHCAMPLMAALGIVGCLRASIALYTSEADLTQLATALAKAKKLLG